MFLTSFFIICRSLKSGYGFLPNFGQPNNQSSRMKRSTTDGPTGMNLNSRVFSGGPSVAKNTGPGGLNEMRIFARSPEAGEIKMQLSPLERRKSEKNPSKRPTSTEIPEKPMNPIGTQRKKSKHSDEHSYSRTDHASQRSSPSPKNN